MANNKFEDKVASVIIALGVMLVIVVLLIIFVGAIVLMLIPPVFLIWGIVSYVLWRKKDTVKAERDFWLTPREKEEFLQLSNALAYYKRQRDDAWGAANREGIRVNQNGRLSAKSYRGQDLQGTIDESESFISDNTPAMLTWCEKPRKDWKTGRKHFCNSYGMLSAVVAGLLWFVINLFGSPLPVDEKISESRAFQEIAEQVESFGPSDSAEDNTQSPTSTVYTASYLRAAVFMIVAYAVIALVALICYVIKYRRPPIVNSTNIDDFPKPKKVVTHVQKDSKPKKENKVEDKAEQQVIKDANAEFTAELASMEAQLEALNPDSVLRAMEIWKELLKTKWSDVKIFESLTCDYPKVGVQLMFDEKNKFHAVIEFDPKAPKNHGIYIGLLTSSEDGSLDGTLKEYFKGHESLKNFIFKEQWYYCLNFVKVSSVYNELINLIETLRKDRKVVLG